MEGGEAAGTPGLAHEILEREIGEAEVAGERERALVVVDVMPEK